MSIWSRGDNQERAIEQRATQGAMKYEVASLSDLDQDRLALRMVDLFTGDLGRGYENKVLMTLAARLVDRGLVSYESARARLEEFEKTGSQGNFAALFRAVGSFEECLVCVHRAIRVTKVLGQRGVLDSSKLPSRKAAKAIKTMRDAIEHFEDRILRKRKPWIRQGESTLPMPKERGLALGTHHLEYATLAKAIRALHEAVGEPIA